MAFDHFALTLSGVAQRLYSVLANTEVGGPNDLPCRQIILAADPANTAVVYVGGSSAVSATSHAFSLDPTAATALDKQSIGPFEAGPVKLSDFWALGTANERLMIGIVPF